MTEASADTRRIVGPPMIALALIVWGLWGSIGCQDPVDAGEVVEPGHGVDDTDETDDVDDTDDERDTANEDRTGTNPRRTEDDAADREDTSDGTNAPNDTVPAELASGQAESADGDGDAPDDGSPPEEHADVAAEEDADESEDEPAQQPTETAPSEGPVIHNGVIDRFEISRFALARDIVDREPVGITDTFERGSGPLHVFIEARNRTGENIELHVGFSPAESERRGAGVRLNVPSTFRYRTRARANTRRRPGEWICVVTDERGRVLVEQRFRITQSSE